MLVVKGYRSFASLNDFVIAEVLKVVGKVSVVREEWVMAEMRGAR